jgi:hypothetical protein
MILNFENCTASLPKGQLAFQSCDAIGNVANEAIPPTMLPNSLSCRPREEECPIPSVSLFEVI